ncbi:hypothetical protein SLNHY_2717 [Streptomyces albus]|nr:hypothetical protein SLNHY_2717 [Streptomyces albus]
MSRNQGRQTTSRSKRPGRPKATQAAYRPTKSVRTTRPKEKEPRPRLARLKSFGFGLAARPGPGGRRLVAGGGSALAGRRVRLHGQRRASFAAGTLPGRLGALRH